MTEMEIQEDPNEEHVIERMTAPELHASALETLHETDRSSILRLETLRQLEKNEKQRPGQPHIPDLVYQHAQPVSCPTRYI
jgi:hypothetical protein